MLTDDNRIVEKDGISLSEILEKMKKENGKVIHNSFLEKIDESATESVAIEPVDADFFNYIAD